MYYLVLILACLVAVVLFKKLSAGFKWIAVLIFVTTISEIIAGILGEKYGNNNVEYHVFTPVEYFLYAMIYSKFFHHKKWNTALFISVLVLFILEPINTYYFQSLSEDNTNIIITEGILLVILSLLFFAYLRTEKITENILFTGEFWFNSIVLLYYAYSIFFSGLQNIKIYLLKDPPMIIYTMNVDFSIALYIIYSFALCLNYRQNRKSALLYV